MRRWVLAAAAMLVACGGSPFEAASTEVLQGDDAGATSSPEAGDEGEHASEAGDARTDAMGAPHADAGSPEADPPEAGELEAGEDAQADAPGTETGTVVTCPGGTAALGCTDFEGTPLCVATGVNLTCSVFDFSTSSAAKAQYDQYKGAGWPDCVAGGQPVPNPRLMAPGEDCVVMYGLEVQAFFARCPSGAVPNDGGC